MFITRRATKFFVIIFFMLLTNFCLSQSNELKGWSSVEYGFEINDLLKIDLSQHFRLKEDLNVVDTYITESEISYEPINKLTLLGQLRYYSRNDNSGGIQGFENMMRYRLGIEKKFNSNKFNFELRAAYQNRFSLDRKNRAKKRFRLRPLIELKMKDWSNNPKIYFEYFDEIEGNDQKAYRYGISKKINTTKSQSITLRYFYQKYKEKYSPNSSANIISLKYSIN